MGKMKDWKKATIILLAIFAVIIYLVGFSPYAGNIQGYVSQAPQYIIGTGQVVQTEPDTGVGDWSQATIKFKGQQIKAGTTASETILNGNCTLYQNGILTACTDPQTTSTFSSVTTTIPRGANYELWVYNKLDDSGTTRIIPYLALGVVSQVEIPIAGRVYGTGTGEINCKDDADGASGGSINNCRIVIEEGATDTTKMELKEATSNGAIPGPFLVCLEFNNTCYDEVSVVAYTGCGYTVTDASTPDWLSTVGITANVVDCYKVTLTDKDDYVVGTDAEHTKYGVLFDYNAIQLKLKIDAASSCDPGNSTNTEYNCNGQGGLETTGAIGMNITTAGWDEDSAGNFMFPVFEDVDGTEPWGVPEISKLLCVA